MKNFANDAKGPALYGPRPRPRRARLRHALGVITLASSLLSICSAEQNLPAMLYAQGLGQALANPDRLPDEKAAIAAYHFEIKQAMHCGVAPAADPNQCQITLLDLQNNARSAVILFTMYDEDFDFEETSAAFKKLFTSQPGRYYASDDGGIRVTSLPHTGNDPKVTSIIPGHCYQALGDKNGVAGCIFQVEPRVVIATMMDPASAGLQVGQAPKSDIDDATTMALAGIVMLTAAKSSLQQAAIVNNGAESEADFRERLIGIMNRAAAAEAARKGR